MYEKIKKRGRPFADALGRSDLRRRIDIRLAFLGWGWETLMRILIPGWDQIPRKQQTRIKNHVHTKKLRQHDHPYHVEVSRIEDVLNLKPGDLGPDRRLAILVNEGHLLKPEPPPPIEGFLA